MINKLTINIIHFLLISSFSVTNLNGQFDCEGDKTNYLLKKENAKIVSKSCSASKCIGKIIWENGMIYSGEIEDGKMDGKGEINFPGKYKYKGEFNRGQKEGTGKIIWENGATYEGEWQNGKKNGFGAFLFPCGNEYLGQFNYGHMEGEGVLRLSEKESYSGIWKKGLLTGQGIHFRSDGSQFIGEYKNGEPNGIGMIVWESKDTMRGIWKEGLLENLSHFQFENGSSIIQFWKQGKIQKKAIYVQSDGFNISGSPDDLVKLLLQSSLSNNDSIESNFSLAWYIAAMEYKSQDDFDGATEQLKYAQLFQDPFEDTEISNLLDIEIQNIADAKERLGVAQKGKVKNQ